MSLEHQTAVESAGVSIATGAPKEELQSTPVKTTARGSTIPRRPQGSRVPLGFAQQRLWFLDQLHPGSPNYNYPSAVRLTGALNREALQYALTTVVARHEALRTRFVMMDGCPAQVIDAPKEVALPVANLCHLAKPEREAQAAKLLETESRRPFDLSKDPMLRALLVQADSEKHLLLVTIHHIATDAWSMNIFFRELAKCYSARVAGQEPALPELPVQYPDFAIWQRKALVGESLENLAAYWKKRLQGASAFNGLPFDHPRPDRPSFRGGVYRQRLPASLAQGFKELSRKENVSPFRSITYLAAFLTLLHRYSRNEDIVVGCPIAGRNLVETELPIGFFVNSLPIRADFSGNPTFTQILARVREVMFGAFAHQDLPFEKLIEELHPERTGNQVPLIQVMFVFQNGSNRKVELPNLVLEPVELNYDTAKFDLTLFLEESAEGLVATWEYSTDLFEKSTIERMSGHFASLLEAIVADPVQRVSDLAMLAPDERRRLLIEWTNTGTEYPREQCIQQLFEEQVRVNPDAPAVIFGERYLTYQELNTRANQLAHHLAKAGVKRGVAAGLGLERSPGLIVALLGILKAGGGYAALDMNAPAERLASMLADLQTPVVVAQEKVAPAIQAAIEVAAGHLACAPTLIYLDKDWESIGRESEQNPQHASHATDLAYISFTSGSTGRSKGVCVPHRGVVRLVRNTGYAKFSNSEVFLQLAPVSFDASTFEIWGALLNGARLVVFPPQNPSLVELGAAIKKHRVTTLWLTSGLFNQMVDERLNDLRGLRQLLTGGDVLSVSHVKKARAELSCKLINGYGPTENTTFTACYAVPLEWTGGLSVPIGHPIANTQCYVVDERLQPVPIGAVGELLIGGDGLALGYLSNPELTAEKFVPNPFVQEPGARLYRTGDLARFLPDGTLEFHGRTDSQVKVRGFRIELDEIESALGRHPAIRECAVIARQNGAGDKCLAAYFVAQENCRPSDAELRRSLGETLPDYMVPSYFIRLDALPLTLNGKVDRRALPAPDNSRPNLEVKYVAPRNDVERALAEVWESVLGARPIGREDRFFELGGHSLLAVKLLAQVEKKFGRNLALAAVFKSPTIAQMAELLRDPEGACAKSSVVAIQSKGSQPPLFFVHGVGGGMFWGYTNLSRRLGLEQPVFAFNSRAIDGEEEFDRIEEMAAQYIADMRAIQPHGPYHLAGYCFGGNVAYEMARQLQQQDEPVAFLGVMNSMPPNSDYSRMHWDPIHLFKFLWNVAGAAARSLRWGPRQATAFVQWKAAVLRRSVARLLSVPDGKLRRIDAEDLVDLSTFPPDQRRAWETHIRALLNYYPRPYAGRVTLFRSRGHQLICSFDEQYGWGELAREVEVEIVPGSHESILEEPHVKFLAERLSACLLKSHAAWPPLLASSSVAARQNARVPLATGWNDTAAEYPRESCLHELFDEQVQRSPDAVAVICEDKQLTYAELQKRADRLARHLQGLGVTVDTPVAICVDRSFDVVVGVLGILKAGGAYVPLDPAYPQERLALMLGNAKINVLITQKNIASLASFKVEHTVFLDLPLSSDGGVGRPLPKANSRTLAYVIHTSGSTGKPKGVAMEHRALVNLVSWQLANSCMRAGDRTLQFASLSFDVSFQEMFSTWLSGGVLVLVNDELRRDAARLCALLQEWRINRLFLPFVALNQLAEAIADGAQLPAELREVITAGEQLRVTPKITGMFERLENCTLHNHYGPSESHVVTAYTLSGKPPSWPPLPPIGRPIANTQIHLLNERLIPVPIGEAGELYIGGDCLARGYLNQPELTAERFIEDPFRHALGARLYKTGDLARYQTNGDIEFLGRADHQAKIRGYRVEPGEIETVLARHPSVRECVVIAREDSPDQKRLVAYVVCHAGQTIPVSEMRRFLQKKLPDYMVPAACVSLDSLPLTPSGKVNRLGLPAPEPERPELETQYVAPANSVEEHIAKIWQEVLGINQIGVRDDFFELGGHSLFAAQVISRMREAFGIEPPVAALFEASTVTTLAGAVAEGRWARNPSVEPPPLKPVPRTGHLPLSFAQRQFWFLDRLDPGHAAGNVAIAFRLKGSLNAAALRRSLAEIVRRHEILRTTVRVVEGRLEQFIAASAEPVLSEISVASLPESRREEEMRRLALENARRPFDLERGPMLRSTLVHLRDDEHVLLVGMHHIVSDGWSLWVFFEELDRLYVAITSGNEARALPTLAVQYADYAQWQQEWMSGQVLESRIAWWQARLAGVPPALELPCDRAPGVEASVCASVSVDLPVSLNEIMQTYCRREGVTPFMGLLAALSITLYRWVEQEDFVIGTIVAGRDRRELENLLGCFMNFLPLRIRISPDQNGRQLQQEIRRTVLEAQAHHDCPFERIVEAINPERRLTQNPIYNVALLLQNFPSAVFRSAGLKAEPVPVDLQEVVLDLRFVAEEKPQGLTFTCDYKTDLFERTTIERLLGAFRQSLETLMSQPARGIRAFDPGQELIAQAVAARDRQDRQTIAIAATFTAEPINESLKYWMKELNVPAQIDFAPYNQIFQQLLDPTSLLSTNTRGLNVLLIRLEDWEQFETEQPANPNQAGASRDLSRKVEDLVQGMKTAANRTDTPWLVVLCPPGHRVTNDPARLAIDQAAQQKITAQLESVPGFSVVNEAEINRLYPVAESLDPRADELGSVPYTTAFFAALGTIMARKFHALKRHVYKAIILDCDETLWAGVCGEDGPGGVRLDPPRRALQEFMRAQLDAGMLLCLCSKNNDEDVEAVFRQRSDMPLRRAHFAAARVNWRSKSENIKSLAEELRLGLDSFIFVDDNPVECAAVESDCPQVLTLQLPEAPELIPQFLDHCWVFDHLSLTAEDLRRAVLYHENQQREQFRAESSGLAEFIAGLDLRVEIAPVSDNQVPRVAQLTQRTNQFNFTTRRRAEGEILACRQAGQTLLAVTVSDRFGDYGLVGVAICDKSTDALVVDTFLLSCRVLGRGVEHEMLARLGKQALHQGLRFIDLHFVSSAKNRPAFDFLESVVGRYRQSLNGGYVYRLPAEVAVGVHFKPPTNEQAPVSGELPARQMRSISTASAEWREGFYNCRRIALEANDVTQILKAIAESSKLRSEASREYVGPRNETEDMLCRIWADLLRVERVGAHDNFFELGGHSLLAVRLFSEIEQQAGRKLPLITIFQNSTIESLADAISQQSGQARSSVVAIQAQGSKPPLFLVHGAGGDVLWGYANLAAHLGPDRPVYGIKSRALNSGEEFATLEEMAAYYVRQVRRIQRKGPYYLGGYCFGGNVAYEMARQLRAAGEEIALVALLDAAPANGGYERMQWWRPGFAIKFAINFRYWLEDFLKTNPRDRREFVSRKARAWRRKIARKFFRSGTGPEQVDLEEVIDLTKFPQHELRLWQLHLNAAVVHVSRPYPGRVTLFRTKGQPLFCSLEADFCWGRLVGGDVDIRLVPGSHESIFMEPDVRHLAAELNACLESAGEPRT
jgi:amino acid adenylation domain-containing protein/FkbH-like protein